MVGASPDLAYEQVRKKLRQRFGRTAIVATDFERKLVNWPKIGNNDAQGLCDFSDFLEQVVIASEHLPTLKIFEYPSKLQSLVDKLPTWFQTKWSSHVQTLQQVKGYDVFPGLLDLVREVTFHADRMNIPQIVCHSSTNNSNTLSLNTPTTPTKSFRRRQPGMTTSMATKINTSSQSTTSKPKLTAQEEKTPDEKASVNMKSFCLYHKKTSHTINSCKKFREIPLSKKKRLLLKNKPCYKCATPEAHLGANCKETPPECSECHKQHLTALHDESKHVFNQASTSCTQVCGEEEYDRSCARNVLVKVSHQSTPTKEILTHAVLDDQSTDVFITDNLLQELQVTAPEQDVKVNTIIGSSMIRSKIVTGLHIQDINHKHACIKIPHAYSCEYIPATHRDIATPHIFRQWKHLAVLADKIPNRPDVEIGLLIGRNVPAASNQLM